MATPCKYLCMTMKLARNEHNPVIKAKGVNNQLLSNTALVKKKKQMATAHPESSLTPRRSSNHCTSYPCQRIHFKILLLVLNVLGLKYICDLFVASDPSGHLRQVYSVFPESKSSQCQSFSRCCFPNLWN